MMSLLNAIADKWFTWQIAMLWQTAVLIAIIWIADLLIRKWAWPQVRYALWMLVLVKLLIPPTFTSPTSVTSHIPAAVFRAATVMERLNTDTQKGVALPAVKPALRPQPENHTSLNSTNSALPLDSMISTVETVDSGSIGTPTMMEQPVVPQSPVISLSWKVYTMFIWLAGIVVLSIWLIARLSGLRKEHIKNGIPFQLPRRFSEQLEAAAQKLNLKRLPQVILTDKVSCPAVFGVFRPVLLMPAGKFKSMSTQDTEHIFLHELAHIKRGDLLIHAVYMTLQIAYWFNPLLWIIRKTLQNLRELCCDATVAKLLREDTVHYRQTLLETARRLLAEPVDPGLGLLGLFENSNWLVARLKWLEKKTWKNRRLRIVTIILLVALMTTCVLPMGIFEGPPNFVIKGTVTDSETGQPIAGAKVGDNKEYNDGKFSTVTDSNGHYEYKTWHEEHFVVAEADEYKPEREILLTKLFGSEKEKIIDFKLVQAGSEPVIRWSMAGVKDNFIEVIRENGQSIKTESRNYDCYKFSGPQAKEFFRMLISDSNQSVIFKTKGLWLLKPTSSHIRASSFADTGNLKNNPFVGYAVSGAGAYKFDYEKNKYRLWIEHELVNCLLNSGSSLNGSVFYKGDLTAGQVLVFVGKMPEVHNIQPYHLIIYQAGYTNEETPKTRTQNSELKTDNYTATLPNGVTVELVGICEHPSEGKQWWRPDGDPLDKSPYPKMKTAHTTAGGSQKAYEAAIRINGDDVDYRFGVVGTNGCGSCGTDDPKIFAASFNQPDNAVDTDIKIGIAAGPWQQVASQQADFSGVISGQKIIWHGPIEQKGQTVLTMVHNLLDTDTRIIAIGVDGKEHTGGGTSAVQGGMKSVQVKFFKLPLSKIKEFRLQSRLYEEVTFKNISLRPGVKTNVEISMDEETKAASGSDPMGEEPAFSPQSAGFIPGDILEISVFELYKEREEAVLKRQVSENGLISIPDLEPIKAEGMNQDQLRETITQCYKEKNILKNPIVAVINYGQNAEVAQRLHSVTVHISNENLVFEGKKLESWEALVPELMQVPSRGETALKVWADPDYQTSDDWPRIKQLLAGWTKEYGFDHVEFVTDEKSMTPIEHSIDFEITSRDFQSGDSIEITEILGISSSLEIGRTYTIKGKYKLSSCDKAMLHIYATNGETQSKQGDVVKRGTGEFTRTFTYLKEGWLHLSFYPADGGSSFGGMYFAQKGTVPKPSGPVDITPADFKIRFNEKRKTYNLMVSIQNQTDVTIPKHKIRYYRSDPGNNLDETGNPHSGWHEAGPLEPGKTWNESTRDFYLPDGDYTFTVVLDYDNAIEETNEDNNRATLEITIKDGQVKNQSSSSTPQPFGEKPQIVSIYPPEGAEIALVSELQLVFDRPMNPEKFEIYDASLEGDRNPWKTVSVLRNFVNYDASSYQFTIPISLPCNWNGSIKLDGFQCNNGTKMEAVTVKYLTLRKPFSAELLTKFEKAEMQQQLKEVLEQVKKTSMGLNSLQVVVHMKRESESKAFKTFFDEEKEITFKIQGNKQFYADMSRQFGKPWVLGSDGQTCWFYNEYKDNQRLVTLGFDEIDYKNINLCDLFGLRAESVNSVLQSNNLEYVGTGVIDEKQCDMIRDWKSTVRGDHATCSVNTWFIDSETHMPLQVLKESDRNKTNWRFEYERINQSFDDSEFRPESVTDIAAKPEEPLGEGYDTRFINVIDGTKTGRMSIRWGKKGSRGTSSSGMN